MNRRDIILAAVFINLGLLSLLFFFAMSTDEDKFNDQTDLNNNIAMVAEEAPQPILIETSSLLTEPGDELDNALKDYASAIITSDYDDETPEPVLQIAKPKEEKAPLSGQFVEVTIKRGDALEKIARANNTTVEAIKQINHLSTDRVYIGQVLKVPVGIQAKASTKVVAAAPAAPSVTSSSDAQYYVIKSGDNPWKIAKQFNVKFDDLLKLNDLDEEKARNMKIGERIRVR